MKTQGFAIPVLVYWLAGGALLSQTIPNWRITSWFKPAPPTAALLQAQADLDKAKNEAKVANDALEAVKRVEEARKREQSTFGQEMAHGAEVALKTAPESPQVALAKSLLSRANPALVLALGELPADKRNEILLVISQSLSGVSSELEMANQTLAIRDRDLVIATQERDLLKKRIPLLEEDSREKGKIVEAATAREQKKSQEVVVYAQKMADEIHKSGGLFAQLEKLWRRIILLIVGYVFMAFILPGIVQVMGAGKLKNLLRDLSGYVLNPLHHHDAKTTINELKSTGQ